MDLASAATIGQTGGTYSCAGTGGGGVFASPAYVVPPGGGTLTSFSFQSRPVDSGAKADFLALRPFAPRDGAPFGGYTVVGRTGIVTLAGTGLEAFPVDVPVSGSEILGTWTNLLPSCLRADPNGSITAINPGARGDPSVGEDLMTLAPSGTPGYLNNESAQLTPTPALTVACGHTRVALETTCTATVTGSSSPSGTAMFSSDSSGIFDATSCSLVVFAPSQAHCSVGYTPTTAGSGSHRISVAYSGDLDNAPSSASTMLAVDPGLSTASLVCSPSSVPVGGASTCSATVTGVAPPTGTVGFATNSSGSFGSPACSLASLGGNQAVCAVTYTPIATGSGSHAITATYSGDANNMPTQSSAMVTIQAPSMVKLVCSPSATTIGHATTCAATVTGKTHISGTVSFASDSSGTFSAMSCTLALLGGNQARCGVFYTPSRSGTHAITAHYSGDTVNAAGVGSANVTVPGRQTTTTVSCTPGTVNVGTASTCTTTVSALEGTPTGQVALARNSSGAFSATTCTLVSAGASSASCSVTYTPGAVGSGAHKIYASYAGDAGHDASTGSTTINVK
ncbi:MAG: large repetitive protein [Solirubrobacteraceae bacterium]|nr:large repetitive protein [Solirubrobacteraceae bacterium]